ncbi:hypothetical protein LEP1GSC047_4022 [Leptospira inadai serovar Lyme str. 10]|uniref:Uncharacterized protein n=1 Tax=Leptospira inadai serovar Lyme str. 10 TaxID=1049790 RepID=V6HM38_9LEPT|nr:hypothetical protein LEP1GSC047_4022 [Leptospira inadai serovar Lyme str. 10]
MRHSRSAQSHLNHTKIIQTLANRVQKVKIYSNNENLYFQNPKIII